MMTNILPAYSFGGDEVYEAVPTIVAPYGKKVCVIGGKTALEKALPLLKKVIEESEALELVDAIVYGKECCYSVAKALSEMPAVQEADVLFAVGGGKAIDTVKIVSGYTGSKPFFTFPTVSSTCAPTSKVAAVYKEDHVFDGVYYNAYPAVHCFINARILVEAPERFIWAGMGDTIAKCYESAFSGRGNNPTYEGQMGVTIAKMCAEPVKANGVSAMEAAKAHVRNAAFDQMVMAVIYTTGLASNFLEENLNSNAAHAMCYGFTTQEKVEKNHLHGEIVSYGVLVLLTLDEQLEERDQWLSVYKAMGLPTKLADLDMTLAEMEPVYTKALSVQDIVVSPYTITKEHLVKAVESLETL